MSDINTTGVHPSSVRVRVNGTYLHCEQTPQWSKKKGYGKGTGTESNRYQEIIPGGVRSLEGSVTAYFKKSDGIPPEIKDENFYEIRYEYASGKTLIVPTAFINELSMDSTEVDGEKAIMYQFKWMSHGTFTLP